MEPQGFSRVLPVLDPVVLLELATSRAPSPPPLHQPPFLTAINYLMGLGHLPSLAGQAGPPSSTPRPTSATLPRRPWREGTAET